MLSISKKILNLTLHMTVYMLYALKYITNKESNDLKTPCVNAKLMNAGRKYAHYKRAPKKNRNPKWFDFECSKVKADEYRLLRQYLKTRRNDLENFISPKNLFKNTCSIKADEMVRSNLNDITNSIGDSKSFCEKLRNLGKKKTRNHRK